jgi:hypothetical protein
MILPPNFLDRISDFQFLFFSNYFFQQFYLMRFLILFKPFLIFIITLFIEAYNGNKLNKKWLLEIRKLILVQQQK